MFSLFHPTRSQISVNVSTTTVTTTAEAGRLPLSLTLSSNPEDTLRTAPSTLARGTEDEIMESVTPDLRQDDGAEGAYPYFPTHPFRNPHHARRISNANPPPPIKVFALNSDPCPFPSPPSPPLRRRVSSRNQHTNSYSYAMKLSTRFKFANLLHFIPAGSKKRSRQETQKSGAGGYHYQRVQNQLLQEQTSKDKKSPSPLWRSESYM